MLKPFHGYVEGLAAHCVDLSWDMIKTLSQSFMVVVIYYKHGFKPKFIKSRYLKYFFLSFGPSTMMSIGRLPFSQLALLHHISSKSIAIDS